MGLWASEGSSLKVAQGTGKARDLAFLVSGCSHINPRELFYVEGKTHVNKNKVKMAQTAVCHISLLRPAGSLLPASSLAQI